MAKRKGPSWFITTMALLLLGVSTKRASASPTEAASFDPSVKSDTGIPKTWDYRVRLDQKLHQGHVRLCFAEKNEQGLTAGDRAAFPFVTFIKDDDPLCVSYEVSLKKSAYVQRFGNAVVISPDVLFVRPNRWRSKPQVRASFELPEKMKASLPFAFEEGAYILGTSALRRRSFLVFGQFEKSKVKAHGVELEIAAYGTRGDLSMRRIRSWLLDATFAVASMKGQFPRKTLQVTVQRGAGSGAHWGQVVRGGPPSVHFIVGRETPKQALKEDWVATHEFSHVALPFVTPGGAWLYEGFATYQQNILRARSGAQSPRLALQKMHEGFERGIAGSKGRTLSYASENLRSEHAWMQVYWGGTAIMFLTDIAMRKEGRSLDEIVTKLRICCFDVENRYSALELVAEIDKLYGKPVMIPIVQRGLESEFPRIEDAYRDLGIVVKNGSVTLLEKAPLVEIRRAMLRPSDEVLRP